MVLEEFYPILVLESHRTHTKTKKGDYELKVGEVYNEYELPTVWTISALKYHIQAKFGVTAEEQLYFAGHITLREANQIMPLEDEIELSSLDVNELSLIIRLPLTLCDLFIRMRVPHMSAGGRQELLMRLQSIPTKELDLDSLHETTVEPEEMVSIRNYSINTIVPHLIIDGEEFIPHHFDENSKMIQFRSKYPYQYAVASDEYAKELREANKKYESDLAHCKKLLHDLSIASENGQQKLLEDSRVLVEEKSNEIELSDLGALFVEQFVIAKEITAQEERLAQLKPIEADESKFITYEFRSEIHLAFGWHKFNDTIYELSYQPTESEINSMLQPKRLPVQIKHPLCESN